MDIDKNEIKDFLDRLSDSINSNNIELYKELLACNDYNIDNIEDFFYSFIYPYREFLNALIQTKLHKSIELVFLYTHYDYIEHHFTSWFERKEGIACSADKSRAILRSLSNYLITGSNIEFDYNQEFTYHLPKLIFKEHKDIIDFYKAIESLYFGKPDLYMQELLKLSKING